MTSLITQPVFALYAIASGIIIVTLYALGFYTAKIRNDRKAIINPEDFKVNTGAHVVDVEHPDVQRIKRTHTNALENAVPFFVMGFIYTQTSPSVAMAAGLFSAFVAVRLFHAFFYLTATQPFRTLSFALGGFINVAMAVQVIRAGLHVVL